jgi:dTDP-glucose pyrophosphorylase
VLTARAHIDPDAPLLIANCDQIVDFDCAAYIGDAVERNLDGSILCFKDRDRNPKWSFARVNGEGLVDEVKEKVAISDLATIGLYYFRRAGDFIDAATDMIARNDRSNNEFYVCPVYNYMIRRGARIGVYNVEPEDMHGIGTPSDLDAYLRKI